GARDANVTHRVTRAADSIIEERRAPRGGSSAYPAVPACSTYRDHDRPSVFCDNDGFRLALAESSYAVVATCPCPCRGGDPLGDSGLVRRPPPVRRSGRDACLQALGTETCRGGRRVQSCLPPSICRRSDNVSLRAYPSSASPALSTRRCRTGCAQAT